MARQARHYGSREVLDTRVDYVESKLDETINSFKEALSKSESRLDETIKDFKEAMQQMESRHKEANADIKEMVRDNRASLEKAIAKAESSRNWVVGFVITVAIAIIGFILNYMGIIQA